MDDAAVMACFDGRLLHGLRQGAHARGPSPAPTLRAHLASPAPNLRRDEGSACCSSLRDPTSSPPPAPAQFFYLWESLINLNGLRLGRRQDGTALGHVSLPRWARGSAWRLVRTLRQALESPHVSRELPGWIDLIFGAVQQGEVREAGHAP